MGTDSKDDNLVGSGESVKGTGRSGGTLMVTYRRSEGKLLVVCKVSGNHKLEEGSHGEKFPF